MHDKSRSSAAARCEGCKRCSVRQDAFLHETEAEGSLALSTVCNWRSHSSLLGAGWGYTRQALSKKNFLTQNKPLTRTNGESGMTTRNGLTTRPPTRHSRLSRPPAPPPPCRAPTRTSPSPRA